MALRSKLLDEKVVESAKEMLKKVRNNAYVSKKLNAVIAAKKYSINANSGLRKEESIGNRRLFGFDGIGNESRKDMNQKINRSSCVKSQ